MLQGHAMLYLAILAQALLTIVVYVALAIAKSRAMERGGVDRNRAALHADAWPDTVIRINNNIRNQFEVPVLFYVLCLVLIGMNATGYVVQALAWLFVATRIVHAWVATRNNFVPLRRSSFMAGVAVLAALWVVALLRLL